MLLLLLLSKGMLKEKVCYNYHYYQKHRDIININYYHQETESEEKGERIYQLKNVITHTLSDRHVPHA